jgi:hypothetical protein
VKVIKAYPPNYAAIRKACPQVRGQAIIFAYGDTIYYPGPGKLSPSLIAHEEVHGARQLWDPEAWWARYLTEPKFRLDEEVLAHRAEYQALFNSGAKFEELDKVARRLCSPLYGAGMTLERARDLVRA